MRQTIGPLIEFAIAHLLRTLHRRQCLGVRGRLGLDQMLHGLRRRVLATGDVKPDHDPLAFARRQHRDLPQRRGRIVLQRRQQIVQRGLQVIADPHAVHLWHRLHAQAETGAEVVDADHQRIVAALARAENLDPVPGHACRFGRAVAIVEQAAEQRQRCGHTAATLGQRQRGLLMRQQLRQTFMGRAHALLHRRRADADPQRQGVDEHAECAVGALAALHAPEQHGTEYHFLTARDLCQHLAPGLVHQTRGADAEAPRLFAQALGHARIQRLRALDDAAAIAMHVLHTEGHGRLVDVAEHVAEKRFVRLGIGLLLRLRHVVAVLHRHRQIGAARVQAVVHFRQQHFQCGVVEHDVVQQQDADPALLLTVFGVGQTHQRRAAQVEAVVPWIEPRLHLLQHIAFQQVGIDPFQRQRRFTPDHLHRFFKSLPDHAGAQNIVALDHRIQRTDEGLDLRQTGEGELRLQHVGVTGAGRQMVVENPRLQRCQAVNVLHIADAAGHAGDHAVDGRLIQRGQRQHVRGNPRAIGSNQILRHLPGVTMTQGRRQCCHARLTEQHAHVALQVVLAHALDQFHRQQRMAAELEEIVVSPDQFNPEQGLPDAGDQGFNFPHWGFETPTGEGIAVRLWQGFAIELAVGGQRYGVEAHKRARHHVVGQRLQQRVAQLRGARFSAFGGQPVGDQTLVPGTVFTSDYQRFAHPDAGGEASFNFTELNAETPDLHLIVVAPQVFEAAIR